MNNMINNIGFAIGVISFLYAIYTQREAKKLKEYQIGKLKSSLKDSITVMSESFKLMKHPDEYEISSINAIKKISSIHITSASLIRSQFHGLSKIDTPFDEKRIKDYIKSGLITSKWVGEQALIFVDASNEIDISELPENTKDWFEKG